MWKYLKKISDFLEIRPIIAGLALFLVCLSYFFWLQYAPNLDDPDSFYHIKIAQLTAEQGPITDFPYLKFTGLSEHFADHHFLYHLLLAPFTVWLPAMAGAKLFQAILAALAVLAFFWLLIKMRIKSAFFYALFLLFCEAFVFRINLVKAQPLALILLFIGLYFLMARRLWPLLIISFIYVWSYGGWILMLVIAVLFAISDGLFGEDDNSIIAGRLSKIKSKILNIFSRKNIILVATVASGLVLGLIINPFFPDNLFFYWWQVAQIALVNYQDKINVGAEWYPYNFQQFLENNFLIWFLFIPAMVLFLNYFKKLSPAVKFLFALMILFFIATLKSRRNIEYMIPLTVLFSATVFTAVSRLKSASKDWRCFKIRKPNVAIIIWSDRILILILILALALAVLTVPIKTKKNLMNKASGFDYLQAGSRYLATHSAYGDVVLHSDWDEFPALFFNNDINFYIVGLDPTFMYLFDEDLYRKWADIIAGKRYAELYPIVKNDFGAKYVIITLEHQAIIDNLKNNFYFQEVYRDHEVIIYKVL